MSKVVVNKLQHSTGGTAPELTWFTADGTNNQIAQTTDTSGTLGWGTGIKATTQDGTAFNMPNSIATGKTLKTDGAGNNISAASGANPFTTPDGSDQGWRLCDRIDITKNPNTLTYLILTLPSQYTTTTEYVQAYRLVLQGLRPSQTNGNNTNWKLVIRPTYTNGNTHSYSQGNNLETTLWFQNQSMGNSYGTYSYSPSQYIRPTGNTGYDWNVKNGGGGVSNFDNINSNSNNFSLAGSEGLSGIIDHNNGKTSGAVIQRLYGQYGDPASSSYQHPRYNIFSATSYYDYGSGSNWTAGQNAGGFYLYNNQATTWCDGVIELYACFKNGVVS